MSKSKILVVDDQKEVGKITGIWLQRVGGYEVRVETDATKALDAAREFQPDLILLDVVMPSLDGGDLACMIREDSQLKRTPILFQTSMLSQYEMTPGATIGGFPFIAKSAAFDHLIECIEKHLIAAQSAEKRST